MSYPSITRKRATEIAEEVKIAFEAGFQSALGAAPEQDALSDSDMVGDCNYPREYIERQSQYLRARWEEQFLGDPTAGEAWMASRLHKLLMPQDDELKRDQGFWRYLALFPFRWYLLYRSEKLLPQSYGGHVSENASDGGDKRRRSPQFKNQLLFRTYLWGQISFEENSQNPYSRATLFRETLKSHSLRGSEIDIWHSHLIRVQLGQLGNVPHAFIDSMCAFPYLTEIDPTRMLEKRLTRMKNTITLDVLSADEARKVVDEQKKIVADFFDGNVRDLSDLEKGKRKK